MQRIADLRKQGLWSLKQLPKVQEPSRSKSQWDYLLEEMQWMAVDFAQERRWKIACAKHVKFTLELLLLNEINLLFSSAAVLWNFVQIILWG